jgi:hypothetical protein
MIELPLSTYGIIDHFLAQFVRSLRTTTDPIKPIATITSELGSGTAQTLTPSKKGTGGMPLGMPRERKVSTGLGVAEVV